MSIEIVVDVTNPGHYFAACGLFELTARLDRGAEARFGDRSFMVRSNFTLGEVLTKFVDAKLTVSAEGSDEADDEDEAVGSDSASPLEVGAPFRLALDWWTSEDVKDLKLWAGSMNGPRIANAMLEAIRDGSFHDENLFNRGIVVTDPKKPKNKVEPFCFDARRAGSAHARDAGFSPDTLEMTSLAHPAVEVLCLVGLQRFRPVRAERRVFDYTVWTEHVPLLVAPALCAGYGGSADVKTYRFESWFRTKYNKAFRPAILRAEGEGK